MSRIPSVVDCDCQRTGCYQTACLGAAIFRSAIVHRAPIVQSSIRTCAGVREVGSGHYQEVAEVCGNGPVM